MSTLLFIYIYTKQILYNLMLINNNYLIFVCIVLFFFGACTSESKESKNLKYPADYFPVYSSNLLYELNDDPEDEGFGQIIHFELLPNGDFIINDVMGRKLHRYDMDGNPIQQFSKEGRGPGEFMSMDIKYDQKQNRFGIYDPMLSRMTIIDQKMGTVIQSMDIESPNDYYLELLGIKSDGVFFKSFKGFSLFNYNEHRELEIFFLDFDNDSLKHLISLPLTEYHPTVNQEQRAIFLNFAPMGRRVHVQYFNDQIIYISNDGFGYSVFDHSGNKVFTDSMSIKNLKPYQFNDEQIEIHVRQDLPQLSDEIVKEIIQDLSAQVNPNKPLWFQDSFVDLDGRIWFEIYPELFENESRWIVWETETEQIYQVLFNGRNVRPQNALNDRVFAFKKNEFDLEVVQIYSFQP